MRKKIIVINTFILAMLILSGCNHSSVSDTYEMLSTSSENNTTVASETKTVKSNKLITNKYSEIGSNINIIKFGDTAEVKYKEQQFDVTVENVLIGNNFFDIEKLTDKKYADNLFDFLMDYHNGICNSDGTINQGIFGIDRYCLFVKLKIKNDLNSSVDLGLGSMCLYNMKNENGKWSYLELPECKGIDKIQNYDSHSNFYKFQPNETQEIVLFFSIEKELVTEYSSEFQDGKKVFNNIKTDGPSMVNVYMNTNISGAMPDFRDNMNVLKLNIENGIVVN